MADLEVGNVRAWKVFAVHSERGRVPVAHIFDENGSETFDLTKAVEVEVDGQLVSLQEGALLTVEAHY